MAVLFTISVQFEKKTQTYEEVNLYLSMERKPIFKASKSPLHGVHHWSYYRWLGLWLFPFYSTLSRALLVEVQTPSLSQLSPYKEIRIYFSRSLSPVRSRRLGFAINRSHEGIVFWSFVWRRWKASFCWNVLFLQVVSVLLESQNWPVC